MTSTRGNGGTIYCKGTHGEGGALRGRENKVCPDCFWEAQDSSRFVRQWFYVFGTQKKSLEWRNVLESSVCR